jgi:hypothetical protein
MFMLTQSMLQELRDPDSHRQASPASHQGPRLPRRRCRDGVQAHRISTDPVASDVVGLCMSTDQDMMNLLTQGRLASLRRGSVVVNDGTGTPRRRSCSPKGAPPLASSSLTRPSAAATPAQWPRVGVRAELAAVPLQETQLTGGALTPSR